MVTLQWCSNFSIFWIIIVYYFKIKLTFVHFRVFLHIVCEKCQVQFSGCDSNHFIKHNSDILYYFVQCSPQGSFLLSFWMLESHLQHGLSKLKHLSTALCEQACSFHSVRHIGRIADIPLLVQCLDVGAWPQKGCCSLRKLELLVFCCFVWLFSKVNVDRIA